MSKTRSQCVEANLRASLTRMGNTLAGSPRL